MDFQSTEATIARLSRRYNQHVLNALLLIEPIVVEDLESPRVLARIAADLEQSLNRTESDIIRYSVSGQERILTVTRHRYGLEDDFQLGEGFFKSPEYRSLIAWSVRLSDMESGPLTVIWGDTETTFERFADAVESIISRAKKGISIQRYKGLGEMNPEQLWDTTMDPTVRRLLKVTVEDVIGADETFTTLMGDQVEPRREFIEKNAFAVTNLDV